MTPSPKATMLLINGTPVTSYTAVNIAKPTERKRTIYVDDNRQQVFKDLAQCEKAREHVGKTYHTETSTPQETQEDVVAYCSFSGHSVIKYALDGTKLYESAAAAVKAARQKSKKRKRVESKPCATKKLKAAPADFSNIMLRVLQNELTMDQARTMIQSDANVWDALSSYEKSLWTRI